MLLSYKTLGGGRAAPTRPESARPELFSESPTRPEARFFNFKKARPDPILKVEPAGTRKDFFVSKTLLFSGCKLQTLLSLVYIVILHLQILLRSLVFRNYLLANLSSIEFFPKAREPDPTRAIFRKPDPTRGPTLSFLKKPDPTRARLGIFKPARSPKKSSPTCP